MPYHSSLVRRCLTILVSVITISSPAFAQEPELALENQEDFVSAVLPYGLEFVQERVNIEFDSNERAFFEDYNSAIYTLPHHAKKIAELSPADYKKFIDFPLVRREKFYVFFGAYKNMQQALQEITPYRVAGLANPALQRYATIPAKDRRNDIYLWSPDSPYWYSEYTYEGNAIPFRSYFVIHLSTIDERHTKVEVIEDKPSVNMGSRLSVDSNGAIQHFDIRDVAPTTQDRKFILSCINQFIDRNVPGRHWFNCKDTINNP